jgi:acyl-coenzyme A thioesterase PaaI-like protein
LTKVSAVTPEEINAFLVTGFPGTGNTCEAVGAGWATALMDTSTVGLRPGGIISGPTVFGTCDAALWFACFTVIGIVPMALTSELSIRFLRPARGPHLRARAELHHRGKRSMIGSIVAWTEDSAKPVAVAQGTYVLPVASTG